MFGEYDTLEQLKFGLGKLRRKLEHLFEKLKENSSEDIYPYHMPGHKRQSWGELPEALYTIDITEIEGFDNLHQPEGILLELQKKAARIYGADESFYLVNGSTGGILSAISSAIPAGGHILMARNCHKSAYHGAYLRSLNITYLYPPWLPKYDIFDAVTPQLVAEALEQEPDINAVLLVSPTYEGRISDIGAIAEIVHKKGIPLIVDEAHGAHLGLSEDFPRNSCQLGADLVIHSVHKTLPALTQSALLHVNGNLVNRRLLERFLHIYQSSSPSYLLMASIDNALQYVEQEGAAAFEHFHNLYRKMMHTLKKCRYLKFLPQEKTKQDVGKLLISVKGTKFTGKQLQDILLKNYGLQMEMASESFVLAMFTINDREEAYERMTNALLDIDSSLAETRPVSVPRQNDWAVIPQEGSGCGDSAGSNVQGSSVCGGSEESNEQGGSVCGYSGGSNEQGGSVCNYSGRIVRLAGISLTKAWDSAVEQVSIDEGEGRYAGEFIHLYPPGVPLVVPGERITKEICKNIRESVKQGLNVQGIILNKNENISGEKISFNVLK